MTPINGLGIGTSKFTFIEPVTNNYSVDLDGTNDFVNLGNSTEIKLRPTDTSEGGGITVACWFRGDWWNGTSSGYPSAPEHIFSTLHVGGWSIYMTTRIVCNLNIVDPDDASANTYLEIQGGYKTLDNDGSGSGVQSYRASGWTHVAMTFDGRTLEAYVNGRIETSRSVETVDSTADDTPIRYGAGNYDTDVLLGGDPASLSGGVSGTAGASSNFDGKIDQAAIWNKALDIDAVKEIFDAVDVDGAPLDLTEDSGNYDYSDNLVGYWKMEEGTGTTVEDSSDNSNTGTLKNSPGWSTTTPS